MIEAREMDMLDVQRYWPEAEGYLRRAVKGADPESYLRNVKAGIHAGINVLWRLEDEGELQAYVVTSLYTTDGLSSVARLYLMTAENMDEVLPLLDTFHVWAKKCGAEWMEVIGRKGWERKLKPFGFEHEYTSLLKRVTEEIH